MRISFTTGVMAVFVLAFFCTGSVAQVPGAENVWNGTWVSDIYTTNYQQNGTEIAGYYIPFNPDLYDPGLLEGTVSEDGKTITGVWTESGLTMLEISEDGMSMSGTGTTGDGVVDEPYTYERTVTRVGDIVDPENIWSGSWITEFNTYNITQNGTFISGTHQPLPGREDDPGVFEGTVSEDRKTFSGTWTESGSFSYTMSEDGTYYNGTFSEGLDPSSEWYPINATKML